MAEQLDQLMGKDRDLDASLQKEIHWSDDDVCKYYLCGFCPIELFANTKSDMGICSNRHDDKLKSDYRSSDKYRRMGYEWEFLEFLEELLRGCDRRIERNRRRIETENAEKIKFQAGQGFISETVEISQDFDDEKTFQEHLEDIEGKIMDKFEGVKSAALVGNMQQALTIYKDAEILKKSRDNLYRAHGPKGPVLEVCKICSALGKIFQKW